MLSLEDSEMLSVLLADAACEHDATVGTIPSGMEEGGVTRACRSAQKKPRNAKTGSLPYSTALQRRQKAEIESLREQAHRLSHQIQILAPVERNQSHTRTIHAEVLHQEQGEQLKWRDRAILNWEERNRTARAHLHLRKIYAQQTKLIGGMRTILGRSDTFEGFKFVQKPQPMADRPFFFGRHKRADASRASSKLAWMHLQSGLIMSTLGDNLFVGSSTQENLDENRIETFSITPLPCTVHEAEQILWRYVTNEDTSSAGNEAFNFTQARSFDGGQTPFDRRCVTHLFIQNSKLGTPLYANALGVYRKYRDKSQVDLVGRMRWLLPGDSLEFEDQYINGRNSGKSSSKQQHIIRKLVMMSIADKTRRYLQMMQNAFLDRAGPIMDLNVET
ncbi:hypothetical protein GN244_ATG20340 [Phytophthora infestans]|uniref:Uncharacterized protein n=1 Tax=Phytophthora infestans TaxID=4787 RepID=A0A833WHY1_PHYIN|nr:hypothetical protein GN244_ATG20340 [Phytophthora infestans]